MTLRILIQGGKNMRKKAFVPLAILVFSTAVGAAFITPKFLTVDSLDKTGGMTAESNEYKDVRIRKFPTAVQCYTFREYSIKKIILSN